MTNIFFWQNCISPHQVPYIRHIAEDSRVGRVVLVAPRVDYDERKEMGWEADSMLVNSGLEVYIRPSKEQIDELMQFEPDQSVHLFSGIRGDAETFKFFLQSRKYRLKRGFIQEPPYTYDKPLWMHYVRFFLQDRKFIKDFEYVFAIGEDAVTYFRHWSKQWKVVPFVYCVEAPTVSSVAKSGPLRLCFVGSLSRRKNVRVLLAAVENLPVALDIYGDGEKRKSLEDFVTSKGMTDNVKFHGRVRMEDVPALMQQHDVLVLPSLYDGWGAVVNEALMSGVYAVCSDRCGARLLLGSPKRGVVFKNDNAQDLRLKIQNCIEQVEDIRRGVEERVRWSEKISGKVVANYMIENLMKEESVAQPWL